MRYTSAPGRSVTRSSGSPGAAARSSTNLVVHLSRDVGDDTLARRARSGELLRLGRGVYVDRPDPTLPRWQRDGLLHDARVRSVKEVVPPDAVVCGPSAALVLGARVFRTPDTLTVASARKDSTTKRSVAYRRQVRRLMPDEVVDVDGVRVTSPLRTLVDCCRIGTVEEALVVADSLMWLMARPIREDRESAVERIEAIRRHALRTLDRESGYRGNRQARLVLGWADGLAEMVLETRVRRAALIVGMPRPVLQVVVPVRNRVYYPDLTCVFHWPDGDEVVHVEADGLSKYVEGLNLDRQQERDSDLRSLGREVVHVSSRQASEFGLADFRALLFDALSARARNAMAPVRELMTDAERRSTGSQGWPFGNAYFR